MSEVEQITLQGTPLSHLWQAQHASGEPLGSIRMGVLRRRFVVTPADADHTYTVDRHAAISRTTFPLAEPLPGKTRLALLHPASPRPIAVANRDDGKWSSTDGDRVVHYQCVARDNQTWAIISGTFRGDTTFKGRTITARLPRDWETLDKLFALVVVHYAWIKETPIPDNPS